MVVIYVSWNLYFIRYFSCMVWANRWLKMSFSNLLIYYHKGFGIWSCQRFEILWWWNNAGIVSPFVNLVSCFTATFLLCLSHFFVVSCPRRQWVREEDLAKNLKLHSKQLRRTLRFLEEEKLITRDHRREVSADSIYASCSCAY